MFQPSKAKMAVFLVLVGLTAAPLFLAGSGTAVIIPAAAIFWLHG
jgi:hypothetical protein